MLLHLLTKGMATPPVSLPMPQLNIKQTKSYNSFANSMQKKKAYIDTESETQGENRLDVKITDNDGHFSS